jgi:hypothetical protein
VPKRKPKLLNNTNHIDESKSPVQPKKFVQFSGHDSRAIETAYQKLTDEHHNRREGANSFSGNRSTGRDSNASLNGAGQGSQGVRVPVHEDFLFDVDIGQRELAPVYWLGPIFQVSRGTWFYDDGKPCDESLASQLETGYLKIKPFRYPPPPAKSSRPTSLKPGEEPRSLANSGAFGRDGAGSGEVTPRSSMENLRGQALDGATNSPNEPLSPQQPQKTYRLFGAHMNSIVTYQDSTVACMLLLISLIHKVFLQVTAKTS